MFLIGFRCFSVFHVLLAIALLLMRLDVFNDCYMVKFLNVFLMVSFEAFKLFHVFSTCLMCSLSVFCFPPPPFMWMEGRARRTGDVF